jgi:phosphate transport system protein
MRHLETELIDLKREFLLMLNRAGITLDLAIQSLRDADNAKAERATASDRDVDAWQRELEGRCLELIARHSLMARDLRFVTLVFASLSELERVGDYAVHIAKDAVMVAPERSLESVSRVLSGMRDDLERAIRNDDANLAAHVTQRDAEVDDAIEQFNRELTVRVLEHPREITRVLALQRVGRSLQRVGDHLENVAERVSFWLTGERA